MPGLFSCRGRLQRSVNARFRVRIPAPEPKLNTNCRREGGTLRLATSVLRQFYINWLLDPPRCGGATADRWWLWRSPWSAAKADLAVGPA
jgi:hypothetical protein